MKKKKEVNSKVVSPFLRSDLQWEYYCRDEYIREEDDEVHYETYFHEVAEFISSRHIDESMSR